MHLWRWILYRVQRRQRLWLYVAEETILLTGQEEY